MVNTAAITATAAMIGIVVGAVLKHFFDLRANRQAKLLEEKLKFAVAFLSASDWVSRSLEAYSVAQTALEEGLAQHSRAELEEALRSRDRSSEQASTSLREAHIAACGLRLLMPELGDTPGMYIALATGSPANGRDQREKARAALEARLVGAFRP